MIERKLGFCPKHGNVEFAYYKSGGKVHKKCLKCQTEAVQKRRDKIKIMAIAYKGGRCQCCGYNKYVGALEFHHIDSNNKDFGIAAKGYTRSWEQVKHELNKCVLVCSNCHREIHDGITKCPEIIEGSEECVIKAEKEFEENYNK